MKRILVMAALVMFADAAQTAATHRALVRALQAR